MLKYVSFRQKVNLSQIFPDLFPFFANEND